LKLKLRTLRQCIIYRQVDGGRELEALEKGTIETKGRQVTPFRGGGNSLSFESEYLRWELFKS